MAIKGHDNYSSKTTITIDDINDEMPLATKRSDDKTLHTLGDFVTGLNKIIKAIKSKIISVDTATKSWHQGKRGFITIDAFTLPANGTGSHDYLISSTEEYTHAYITNESSLTRRGAVEYTESTAMHLCYLSRDWCTVDKAAYMRRSSETYANDLIHYTLELINKDGGTFIRVSWTGNSSYATLFPQTTYYYDCF